MIGGAVVVVIQSAQKIPHAPLSDADATLVVLGLVALVLAIAICWAAAWFCGMMVKRCQRKIRELEKEAQK